MRSKKRQTNINVLREELKELKVKDSKIEKKEIKHESLKDAGHCPRPDRLRQVKEVKPKLRIGRGRVKDQLINTSRLLTMDG